MHHPTSPAAAALLLAASLAAQGEPAPVAADVFPTSIAASTDADGGGLWAAGATWKASFHDGFEFFPVLGPAHAENLPLRWSTAAVRIGEQSLALARRPAPRVAGRRCEFDLGPVVEAYEVRAEGVEQTFLVKQRPAEPGDLVVSGRIATRLVADAVPGLHTAVRFRDRAGAPILDYGAATAIDAAGRGWPMTTRWDGETIELRLPAVHVAAAAFPLLVDPLTTTLPVDAGGPGAGALRDVAVHRNTTSTAQSTLTVYSRTNAANDVDLFAVLGNDNHNNLLPVFSDLSTNWSTQHGRVAFVGAVQKWLVVFERDFGSSSAIRLVAVPAAASAAVTTVTTVAQPIGYATTRRPAVGGTLATSTTGSKALILFTADAATGNADTDHTEVFARTVDLAGAAPVLGAPFVVGSPVGTRYDRHHVAVNRQSEGGNASWLVAYQQYDRNHATASWRAQVYRVTPAGTFHGPSVAFLPAGQHAMTPAIDGFGGRYVLAYGRRSGSGTATTNPWSDAIEAVRVDWIEGQSAGTFGPRRDLELGFSYSYRLTDAAIDTDSRSHWGIVFERDNVFAHPSLGIVRVGGTAGVVESADLYENANRPGYAPAVCFDDDSDVFDAAFAVDTPTPGVYARSLAYPAGAVATTYGVSCGGVIATNHPPRAGDREFAVTLTGALPAAPALLALSFARDSLPLDLTGMPGCSLLVDTRAGAYLGIQYRLVRPDGGASFPIALPDWPVVTLDFCAQWFWLDPAANAAGIRATRGIEIHVR